MQHHVDARNVEPDDARGQRGCGCHAGVNEVRHIQGHVAVALNQHCNARNGHRVSGEALALKLKNDLGRMVWLHRVQGRVLALAAPGVGVDLGVHQFNDAGLTVSRDPGRFTSGCRHHAVTHHQQAVLVAVDVLLHDDTAAAPAFLPGQLKRGFNIVAIAQVQ